MQIGHPKDQDSQTTHPDGSSEAGHVWAAKGRFTPSIVRKKKNLLNAYAPCTALGTWDTFENKADKDSCPCRDYISAEEDKGIRKTGT